MLRITAYQIAERFIGMKEIDGPVSNPSILGMLKLDDEWPADDEVPWCSAFANYVCWLLRLPRSKSLRARSWLTIGYSVPLFDANVGFDVVIMNRGSGIQPGPGIIEAPGHVGFFAGVEALTAGEPIQYINVLGGNQSNSVSVARFPVNRVLGIHRLYSEDLTWNL